MGSNSSPRAIRADVLSQPLATYADQVLGHGRPVVPCCWPDVLWGFGGSFGCPVYGPTSRKPDDLSVFNAPLAEMFAATGVIGTAAAGALLFKVRLGWSLGNPQDAAASWLSGPRIGLVPALQEFADGHFRLYHCAVGISTTSPDATHLGNPARIVAITFADLLALQKRHHVPVSTQTTGNPAALGPPTRQSQPDRLVRKFLRKSSLLHH
jgi:hypothetical protein